MCEESPLKHLSAFCLALTTLLLPAVAQQPKSVPATSIVNEAKELRESLALVGLQKEYVVSGDIVSNSYFVGAETIRFKPGARLIFSDEALKLRNNLLVAAKTIVMEDPEKPGSITWARGGGPSSQPPQSGEASGGPHGNGDGQSGGPGANGVTGNAGFPGRNAPNLTLFIRAMSGAPPIIDLRGQVGGIGGHGQRGGAGGVGRQGSPASSSLFDCRSGAGYGGTGGAGGNGGSGGTGGTGGAGGTVTLVSLPTAFPELLQLIRTDVSGGDGGPGGDGGQPGVGGPGGPQGAPSLPYCKDEPGRHGTNGAAGKPGAKGDPGITGPQGDLLYTTLAEDAFMRLFGK